MLETILSSTAGESLTFMNTIIIITASIILGIVISLVYIKTHKKEGYAPSFTVTLIMLPVIISIIILLVGNNVARAFSLAGAFSIIRFRSAPGDPKDISYVFFTLAVGLACGMGYIGYATIFTIVLCGVMMVLDIIKFATPQSNCMQLKIIVPENLNYEELFDDILIKYTSSWKMERVKTKEFGALFELTYRVNIKEEASKKKFIDELRCKNGNLNISLGVCESEQKVYSY
jgi:hypothetical protein